MADIASLSLSSPSTSGTTSSTTTTHSYSCLQPQTPKTPEISPSMLRLWRPQAQRNLRNQWSKLSSCRDQWRSSIASGRSHATSLVNSYLSIRYMDAMDLGVLDNMPNIRKKACSKLLKQLELQRNQLLSSYKAMVAVVIDMVTLSKSMRCFSKTTTGSAIVQYSMFSENSNDTGDGGGAPVVTFLSVSAFEMLAEELVEMFKQELVLKRLLVVELLSKSYPELEQFNQLSWKDELYHGETNESNMCNLYSKDTAEPFLPKISGWQSKTLTVESEKNPSHDVLQVSCQLSSVKFKVFYLS
uniref:Uncharacterized protein n=1 Tax=Chenopodium quinoa TaxID=63459 RepID=A0A803L9H2_CHEQI